MHNHYSFSAYFQLEQFQMIFELITKSYFS